MASILDRRQKKPNINDKHPVHHFVCCLRATADERNDQITSGCLWTCSLSLTISSKNENEHSYLLGDLSVFLGFWAGRRWNTIQSFRFYLLSPKPLGTSNCICVHPKHMPEHMLRAGVVWVDPAGHRFECPVLLEPNLYWFNVPQLSSSPLGPHWAEVILQSFPHTLHNDVLLLSTGYINSNNFILGLASHKVAKLLLLTYNL